MVDEMIRYISKLNFCKEEEYFQLLKKTIKFVDSSLDEFAGLYEKDDKITLVVPEITDELSMSMAIHEAGHLFDYYKNKQIVSSDDTALIWEFKYLCDVGRYDLVRRRINHMDNIPEGIFRR